jgi:hypothetical protein
MSNNFLELKMTILEIKSNYLESQVKNLKSSFLERKIKKLERMRNNFSEHRIAKKAF